ncbi:MAG: mechanosensitive ion channel family protein [Treponema sp.]|nr:mechanosensitive ion channel family protein [Treponema sp.]
MNDFSPLLQLEFFNNPLWRWIGAAAFVLGGFVAGKVVSLIFWGALKRMRRGAGGKGIDAGGKTEELPAALFRLPLSLLVFLGGIALGLGLLKLGDPVRLWTGRLLGVLFIVIAAWGLGRVVDSLILRCGPAGALSAEKGAEIRPLVRRLFNILLWIIAAALILRTLGYNVSALLAGLGLGGAALALASRDTLSNFFGSITVFLDRPFRINDRIKIGDYDGTIVEMGIRSSKLRTLENRTVFIPNSLFASNPIENVSAAPNVKVVQTLRLRGDNGHEKIGRALELLKEIAASARGLEGGPAAGLVSSGGLVCQVTFVYFVSKQADYMETVSGINLAILRRFEEEGIRLV